MSLKSENFGDNFPLRSIKNASFNGLSGFINNLEKHFFSQISVWTNSNFDSNINLIIEIDCDLNLIDMITLSKNGSWGTFNQIQYDLTAELIKLKEDNELTFKVEEFTINLKDTSIIVDQLYEHSIPDQLNGIFCNLEKHFIQLTKGNIEVPYEIFVAVYEDDLLSMNTASLKNKVSQNYSTYWALYFDSEKDAIIYDLNNTSFIYEDLHMIEQ